MLEIHDFINEMNEGLIAVDKFGKIVHYNNKAKEVLGASRNCTKAHPAGKLEVGDIVIMAFTSFGADTGGIEEGHLKLLGIDLLKIAKGTTLFAVGQYRTGVSGKFKLNGPNNQIEEFVMSDDFLGVAFESKVDFVDRYVEISVNQDKYRYYYNNYFNHMVILDGDTRQIKFYQMGGYTLWKEDLRDLLDGQAFMEKHLGCNEKPVIGMHLTDFHQKEEIIDDVMLCAQGLKQGYRRKSGKINGISVISTLRPIVKEDETQGALLIISDMSRLQVTEHQRNLAYRKLEAAQAVLNDAQAIEETFSDIVGSSQVIKEVKILAHKASQFKSTVLILGESGTGKSVLAKAIHKASDLSDQPFISVNLSSIPESLLESEIFGYDKGAFTGANKQGKKGYFEMADGGTLFLDEIGDLPKPLQVKLLHVIQNRVFYRVGGSKEIRVDVRIIVATNRQLERDVKEGLFREDLYYRINVFPIKQPPLRERIPDLHELVAHILPRICLKVAMDQVSVSAEAYDKMANYNWPGNVRELENVLERAVTLCDGQTIRPEHLDIRVTQKNYLSDQVVLKPLKTTIKEVEMDIIGKLMAYTNGDKQRVLEILEIKKTKLYEILKAMKTRNSEYTERL